jgi:uncharacterized membrane protein YraQ (UPF0718 family)
MPDHDPATHHEHAAPPRADGRLALGLQALFLVAAAAMLLAPAGLGLPLGDLPLNFVSIVLEAIPFMMVGALVGGVIEVFVSREWLTARLEGRGRVAVFGAAALGCVFPVCECAVVPVVRRLLRKGVPFPAAVAYLLAAPIVNPIVAASTLVAYKYDWRFVAVRMGGGYVIAVSIALLVGRLFPGDRAVRGEGGLDECCPHCHDDAPSTLWGRLVAAVGHGSDDFFAVAGFLVVGAFIAAFARTLINVSDTFRVLTDTPWLAILLMMGMAVALNLCSEADAFIAASFRGVLSPAAQMAFLLLGPILDVKLVLMQLSIFRKRAVLVLVVCMVAAVFAVAMAAHHFGWLGAG